MGATVFETRRQNLIGLIRDRFSDNRAEFSRSTGKNPNLINLVLTANEEYRRNIGEKLARDIEQRAGLAPGWLDAPRGIGIRNVTQIPILTDQTAVPAKPPLANPYYMIVPLDDPNIALRSSGSGNLVAVYAGDASMAPTIRVGDWVWVDLGVKKLSGDGVYVIKQNEGTVFRRLQQLPDGTLRVSSDDPAYAPQLLPKKAAGSIQIVGKGIAATSWAAL